MKKLLTIAVLSLLCLMSACSAMHAMERVNRRWETRSIFSNALVKANDGDKYMQYLVGSLYMEGYTQDGYTVPKDPEKGVYWLQKATDQGDLDAQVRLGIAYLDGTGVKKDPDHAVTLFEDAAKHGEPSAFVQLAKLYETGHVKEKNPKKAKEYYQKAKERYQRMCDLEFEKDCKAYRAIQNK